VSDDLQDKIAGSRYVLSLDPGRDRIDHKIALEVGMMILLDKPILVVVPPDVEPTPGLTRIAHVVCRLSAPLDSMTGQAELLAAMAKIDALQDES
jgi:hypothetical protein